jgi:hypothetical protein
MSLASIAEKLDKLVKAKEEEETESPEQRDERRLRELDKCIEDAIDLITSAVTRDSVDSDEQSHKQRIDSCKGESRPFLRVMHKHQGGSKRFPTYRRTSAQLDLIDGSLRILKIYSTRCTSMSTRNSRSYTARLHGRGNQWPSPSPLNSF